MMICESLIKQ